MQVQLIDDGLLTRRRSRDAVYYHKPANLGGAAGMAALQQRWFEGEVEEVVIEKSGFRL